ncbi:phage tail protein [Rhizobium tumorigenes]|uniref:phage tail protein n=1 Tax=Rhizobium tumorigenes TaxID=2041385 RepID=UPI00241CDBF0|nr:phage tail protein [Rhizobium tumorigenes]WFS02762.1 phage tail protein [Rhizobium tumorigenes]
MSTPVSMMLGPFGFEAIGFGYEGVSRKVNTPWANIAVAQTLDQQQWTGPGSDEITIKGVLFPVELGGQTSLDGVIAAALSGTALTLVSGDEAEGLVHGSFTIQSVDEDRSYHTISGQPRRNAYSITLKRYGQDAGGAASILSPILSLFG